MSNEHGRINRLQEVEDLTEYINNGWLHSGESDGPTFLWNDMIREASQEDAENRNNVPVAQLSDADMKAYFKCSDNIIGMLVESDSK